MFGLLQSNKLFQEIYPLSRNIYINLLQPGCLFVLLQEIIPLSIAELPHLLGHGASLAVKRGFLAPQVEWDGYLGVEPKIGGFCPQNGW